MAAFSSVVIIYNPKSTGNSRANALKLEHRLRKVMPGMSVKRVATKYAGHAEELAYDLAVSRARPLIVSSSGDGGYYEVINGVMRAGRKARSAICAVLPAGNANDHSRTMQNRPLWRLIRKDEVTKIDLLKVTIKPPGGPQITRYAHSYAGLGLTPVVAAELNRHTLNAFKELSLVFKTFYKYKPFQIRVHDRKVTLDSLIFSNINKMAKVFTLAKENNPDDGRFEVVSLPHGHKLLFLKKIIKAATIGLKNTRRVHDYEFEVISEMPIQFDGEVSVLKPGSKVKVLAANKALATFI